MLAEDAVADGRFGNTAVNLDGKLIRRLSSPSAYGWFSSRNKTTYAVYFQDSSAQALKAETGVRIHLKPTFMPFFIASLFVFQLWLGMEPQTHTFHPCRPPKDK
jgi:hypothetical protein